MTTKEYRDEMERVIRALGTGENTPASAAVRLTAAVHELRAACWTAGAKARARSLAGAGQAAIDAIREAADLHDGRDWYEQGLLERGKTGEPQPDLEAKCLALLGVV